MHPTMKSVFILWHVHFKTENGDDNKLLGVYSNRKIAEQKIKLKFKLLPGFSDNNGQVIIDEYVIDKDYWEEGYITEKL